MLETWNVNVSFSKRLWVSCRLRIKSTNKGYNVFIKQNSVSYILNTEDRNKVSIMSRQYRSNTDTSADIQAINIFDLPTSAPGGVKRTNLRFECVCLNLKLKILEQTYSLLCYNKLAL